MYFHVLLCHVDFVFAEIPVRLFCSFCNWIVYLFYCWVLRVCCIFYIQILRKYRYFLPSYKLSFHFLGGVFWSTKVSLRCLNTLSYAYLISSTITSISPKQQTSTSPKMIALCFLKPQYSTLRAQPLAHLPIFLFCYICSVSLLRPAVLQFPVFSSSQHLS